MRVHLLAVPNTCPTADFELDGFCLRTRLFAQLLKGLGHEVLLYGVERTDVAVDAFIPVLTDQERKTFIGETPYQAVSFELTSPLFQYFNARTQNHVRSYKRPGDILCTIAGSAQAPIADAHPELPFIEYSVGYQGIAPSAHRVYQSHAWRHIVHGFSGVLGGRLCDAVIPPWFAAHEFPFIAHPDPYVVYCGRLVPAKGIAVACEAAQRAGVTLVLIGHGEASLVTYGDFRGAVSTAERNHLLAHASACLMPTQYIEPFGQVAAEAMLCGTPLITSDFGAFTESVVQGDTGYRCTSLGEYVEAIHLAPDLDRFKIRQRARCLYSEEAAQTSYRAFFRRLEALKGDGWRDLAPGLEGYGRPRTTEQLVFAGSDCGLEAGVSVTRSVGPVDEYSATVQ